MYYIIFIYLFSIECHDIAEILLRLVLIFNQSINQYLVWQTNQIEAPEISADFLFYSRVSRKFNIAVDDIIRIYL
jgi:hypothetical protein